MSKRQRKRLRQKQKQRDARMEQLLKELKSIDGREQERQLRGINDTVASVVNVRNSSKKDEEELGPDLMKDACLIEVKIGDLGLAHPRQYVNSLLIQCPPYRAIEVVLGTTWDSPVDIWSIACLVI